MYGDSMGSGIWVHGTPMDGPMVGAKGGLFVGRNGTLAVTGKATLQ